jgi:hypothetical protein
MADYLGLCLALERTAPTQYWNYNFNSMVKFGDSFLGANENGIFVLDSGNDDANTDIEAFFELATSDWGITNIKRVRRIYVNYESNGDLMLSVKDDEDNLRYYLLEPVHLPNKQHAARVGVGRDGKGVHWMVRVENINGSDFSVDRIQVIPTVLGLKPR